MQGYNDEWKGERGGKRGKGVWEYIDTRIILHLLSTSSTDTHTHDTNTHDIYTPQW